MLLSRFDSNSTQYWCHTGHLHSGANAWQQLFGGIHISPHTTDFTQIKVSNLNYQKDVDGLGLLPDSFGDVYSNVLDVSISGGIMTISPLTPDKRPSEEWFGTSTFYNINTNTSFIENDVWQRLINSVAYKLLPDVYVCSEWVGQTRLFQLVATNRLGATSDPVYVTMTITTAGVIYGNTAQAFDSESGILTVNDLTAQVVAYDTPVGQTSQGYNQTLVGAYIETPVSVIEDDAVTYSSSNGAVGASR